MAEVTSGVAREGVVLELAAQVEIRLWVCMQGICSDWKQGTGFGAIDFLFLILFNPVKTSVNSHET